MPLATARGADSVSPFHLCNFFRSHGGLERVDILLSIADVREPVDVRYERQPGRHLLALSSSQFDPERSLAALLARAVRLR